MAEPRFLIDSNIAIYILRDSLSPASMRVQSMAAGAIVTSSIVYAEVMRGFTGVEPAVRANAAQLFDVIEVLPFDAVAAEHYALLPFRRGSFDRLIAAHALALNLVLVTANERDFQDVQGLKIENWALSR